MSADLRDQQAQDGDLVVEPRCEQFDFESLRREQAAALDRLLQQWSRCVAWDCANRFLANRGER